MKCFAGRRRRTKRKGGAARPGVPGFSSGSNSTPAPMPGAAGRAGLQPSTARASSTSRAIACFSSSSPANFASGRR